MAPLSGTSVAASESPFSDDETPQLTRAQTRRQSSVDPVNVDSAVAGDAVVVDVDSLVAGDAVVEQVPLPPYVDDEQPMYKVAGGILLHQLAQKGEHVQFPVTDLIRLHDQSQIKADALRAQAKALNAEADAHERFGKAVETAWKCIFDIPGVCPQTPGMFDKLDDKPGVCPQTPRTPQRAPTDDDKRGETTPAHARSPGIMWGAEIDAQSEAAVTPQREHPVPILPMSHSQRRGERKRQRRELETMRELDRPSEAFAQYY